jgi:hypothetical protein
MPQFDTFIFSSSLFYFIISFFVLLYVNFNQVLPRLAAVLKLRYKLLKKQSSNKVPSLAVKTSLFLYPSYMSDRV